MKRASQKAKSGHIFGHSPRRCMRQPGPGTFPPNTVCLYAIVFAASISFLLPPFARAQNHPTTLSLDGLWVTAGYGEFIEIKGNDLRVYEITTLSASLRTRPAAKLRRAPPMKSCSPQTAIRFESFLGRRRIRFGSTWTGPSRTSSFGALAHSRSAAASLLRIRRS